MIYPNKPLYLLSLLGYIYYLTYYTLTTKDNIFFFSSLHSFQNYDFSYFIIYLFKKRAISLLQKQIVNISVTILDNRALFAITL